MNPTTQFDQETTPIPNRRRLAAIPIAVCLMLSGLAGFAMANAADAEPRDSSPAGDDRPVIGIEHEGPIKVVFQITTPDMKNGVGKGLYYLKKIHAGYLAAGVAPDQLDIRAVFHGDGAEHLLTDEAWNRIRKESQGNPNTQLISELVKSGVSVELCDTRRVANGWAKSDVHPNVLLVKGAYQRIIDLQLRGYAYIRF